MRRAAGWGVLVGAAALALPAPARAADEKATREAQGRFVEGITRVRAGDFEGARMSFAQAYTVLHKPDILWNLALAEDKSGHLVDALAHFKQLARDGATDADRAKANKHVDQLMAETGHIEVAAPPGAQVMVDGESAGVAPLAAAVDVAPGKHHVELRPAQGASKATDTDAFAGQTARVSFLVAEPGATPATAQASGAATEAQAAAPEASPAPQPPPDQVQTGQGVSPARIITVASLGAAGAASVFLGVYFGLAAQSDANDVKGFQSANGSSYCAVVTSTNAKTCSTWNSTVDSQNRDAAVSDGFYVAGGLLVAGAVATWFLWPKGSTSPSATIVPVVGPGGAGLTAVGRF
jgi:hypothetical protein